MQNRLFIRNLYAETLIENFLIAGVTTLLAIRFYLQMTGYPQIGGAHLHIAHMLYGGLLMMVAIFTVFTFLNRTAFNIASIIGGIGFGFFIDELGKFITKDNNYFFEPTIALIYVIFILIYLAGEVVPKYKTISQKEYLLNAFELTKEVIVQDLDTNEKKQALTYLRLSDQKGPIVADLRTILNDYRSKPGERDLYSKTKGMIFRAIEKITQNRQFYFVVVFFIVIQTVISLLITFLIVAALNHFIFLLLGALISLFPLYLIRASMMRIKVLYVLGVVALLYAVYSITTQDVTISLSFIGWGTVLSTAFAAVVAFMGLLDFGKSRLQALRFFRLSVLISIFLTQFFLFYSLQFLALIGLGFNILMLLTIEYVISNKVQIAESEALVAKK